MAWMGRDHTSVRSPQVANALGLGDGITGALQESAFARPSAMASDEQVRVAGEWADEQTEALQEAKEARARTRDQRPF